MTDNSYRTILRSSSIIGGAQAINVLANLVRMKVLAILLGPTGVGLAGLYTSLVQTGSTVAAMGLNTAGTRQIAAANGDGDGDAGRVDRARQALFWATIVLAMGGGAVFWLARHQLAALALDDPSQGDELGWLAVAVALTVASGSQAALLAGLRRIGDLARLQIASGVSSALLGTAAVWFWGLQGIVALVLVGPLVTFVAAHYFVARLPRLSGQRASLRELSGELRSMGGLGFAFMTSALATVLGQLAVRVLVQRELGSQALGYFQASFAVSVTYLGFILNAMGTDYFPRLSAAIDDPVTARRLVNEQTEVALLLTGPVLIALLGLAPFAVHLLYSAEFDPAVTILRWQLLGDILKVMSWPLGFVLLAAGAGRTFVMAEVVGIGVLTAGVAAGLPVIGIEATGTAYVAMYLVYLPLVFWLCARRIGFRWTRPVLLQGLGLMLAGTLVCGASHWSDLLGAATGITGGGMLGIWALLRISAMTQVSGGRMSRLVRLGERVKAWTTRP